MRQRGKMAASIARWIRSRGIEGLPEACLSNAGLGHGCRPPLTIQRTLENPKPYDCAGFPD